MKNELQVILKEQNVIGDNAKALIEAFGAPFTEAGDIILTYKDIEVTDESQKEVIAEAKEKRLALKRIRTGVENKRKELKEDSLRTGKAIDNVARYIKETIQPAEEYLELQEKFVEIQQAKKAAEVKRERTEKLLKYTDELSLYNIDSLDDEQFEMLLGKVKKEHDDKVAAEKAEAERIEKERIEKEAEDKRIREENERLKKEAEKREIELAKERKIEQDRLAALEAERQKEREAEQAKLNEERAKREAIEAEKREIEQAELKKKQEAEELERQALLAPDKEKLVQFSQAIEMIRTTKLPAVKNNKSQVVVNEIDSRLSELYNFIIKESKEL
jgi:hypothetical protein